MPEATCPVCKRPGRRRLIDADLSDGLTPAQIAAAMRDSGWALTAADVAGHAVHATPGRQRTAATRKRDAATTIRERLIDEFERRLDMASERAKRDTAECAELHVYEDGTRMHAVRIHDPAEYFDLLAKDLQSALGTVVKAQALNEKTAAREANQKIDLFRLMLGGEGGGLAPVALIGDGETIEGEFEEVDGPAEA